ncbi:MAG TPA: gluconate 2-dehydrogenase subunit 3 family protein [Steroidobacteraceae bacterium]|nr:gluconate 2-dehydrogenase subunit 3 family protein [Steroidobacteraceae bacterium]
MNDVSNEPGHLRLRIDRRTVLQSLATGVGAAVFAAPASAEHEHHAAAAVAPTLAAPGSPHEFLDAHSFDTLVSLSDQIVPGSRAVGVPEFLDRLLAVESLDTQKRAISVLGAFEKEARDAHGQPWKSLTAEQANGLLTKISTQPATEPVRRAFDDLKRAIAETFYATEAGMKELGWNGSITFAPPSSTCG